MRKRLLAAAAVLVGLAGALVAAAPAHASVTCSRPPQVSGRTATGFCAANAGERGVFYVEIQCQSVNVPASFWTRTPQVPLGSTTSVTCSTGFVPSSLNYRYHITLI